MKLVSAHITNFRCVEDSEEFTLDQVTCLVGKNEAGKTTILKALNGIKPWDSAESQYDRERDYPRRYLTDYEERHPHGKAEIIDSKWQLEPEDTRALVAVLGPAAAELKTVGIVRRYDDHGYWEVPIDEAAVIKHILSTSGLHAEEQLPLAALKTTGAVREALEKLGDTATPRHTAFLEKMKGNFKRTTAATAAIDILYPRMPSFVYFSQYDRMQGQVSLDQIIKKKKEKPESLTRDDRVFLAFCDLVGTPIEDIAALTKFETMVARFGAASNKITRELFAYWTQNRHLKVNFRLDAGRPDDPPPFNTGTVLRTRIFNEHHQMEISFDDRSTGFVWFFSFLVLFSQITALSVNFLRSSGEQ